MGQTAGFAAGLSLSDSLLNNTGFTRQAGQTLGRTFSPAALTGVSSPDDKTENDWRYIQWTP